MGSKALKPLPLPSPPLAPWERTLGMLSSAWGGQGPPGVRPGLQPAPFGLCAIPSQIGAAALAPPAARPGLYQELLGEKAVWVVKLMSPNEIFTRFIPSPKFSKYLLRADCVYGPMLSTGHIEVHRCGLT